MRTSAVPTGLGSHIPPYPALKRWAKIFRPFGTLLLAILGLLLPPHFRKVSSHAHSKVPLRPAEAGGSHQKRSPEFFRSSMKPAQNEKLDSFFGALQHARPFEDSGSEIYECAVCNFVFARAWRARSHSIQRSRPSPVVLDTSMISIWGWTRLAFSRATSALKGT